MPLLIIFVVALAALFLCIPFDWSWFIQGHWGLGIFAGLSWYTALFIVVVAVMAVIGLIAMTINLNSPS